MNQDEMKKQAAKAAMDYVEGGVIGVGTGSTVNHFIDFLATVKGRIDGAVSSSEASTERMKAHGIPVLDLNAAGELALYVDGADESNRQLQLIKGGGGALTREKIVAGASKRFVVHRRRQQAGGRARQVPAAGGGHPHGPQPCRPPAGEARRDASLA